MISIKDNKVRWAISAVLALLILFGTYRYVFSLAAFLIMCLMLAFCDRESNILQIFFVMPMANIFKLSPGVQSFFTVILLVYIVLHLILPRRSTFFVILFAVYVILGQLFGGGFNLFRTIKLICNFLFLSSTLNSNVKINHKNIFFSYIIGNIVASVFAKMSSGFFKIESYIGVKDLGGLGEFKDVVRFAGLYEDPNYYSISLVVSLCLLVVLFYRNEINVPEFFLWSSILVYFLIITYSKSAFIMLAIPLMMFEYTLYKKKKTSMLIVSFLVIAVLILLALSGKIPALNVIISRMTEADSESFDINASTTGRFNLWVSYAKYLIKNIKAGLFGVGIGTPLLNGAAAHNTYFDILYYLGVTGGALLLAVLVTISSQYIQKNMKRCSLNYSVIICILIMYFFLSELFYYDPPFHLLFAFMVLNMPLTEQTDTSYNIIQKSQS